MSLHLPRSARNPADPSRNGNPLRRFATAVSRRLPAAPAHLTLAVGLTLAQRLGQMPRASAALEGRTIAVQLTDFGPPARIRFSNGQARPAAGREPADVTIGLSIADALALLAQREDPDTLFFQRRMSFRGDTELGLEIKNLLSAFSAPAPLRKLAGLLLDGSRARP